MAGGGDLMKGVVKNYRVYSWSGMETKAFGGFWYEIKKKVVGKGTEVASSWYSFWPAMLGSYGLVKWAEGYFANEQLKHRDDTATALHHNIANVDWGPRVQSGQ
eukprot:CAMPEP_0196688578 /NCGR_PEP_ID=MMETSP1090-20130531/16946_1 /TAXON_ID=37098 /ORGANISM="Isochrysis sp, Strain CCMP1244" /LENGTH=103 /DNA_ID=CAMNT_0042027507 /DNA_START=54 /DNA_END=366 /DNA_ORIENTATION=+